MKIPSEDSLTTLLIRQFRCLGGGFDRTLGSLTLEEIDSISEVLRQHLVDEQKEDEPPF
jgi:hypothetical protein